MSSYTDPTGITGPKPGFAPAPSDPDDGKVWVLVAPDIGHLRTHLEVFDKRPTTVAQGGDPGNWPREYEVYEGYVNGGDSALIESYPEGRARCGHRLWRDGHCADMGCPNYINKQHHPEGAA